MIELRSAAERDLDWIACLEAANFSGGCTREMLGKFILDANRRVTVALADGERAGYLIFSSVLDEGSVDSVCTAAGFRRRGAGDALMRAADAAAAELGLASVTLEVRASNAAAIAMYGKHGYIYAGRRPGYYERPREDAVIMTKYFKEHGNDYTCS